MTKKDKKRIKRLKYLFFTFCFFELFMLIACISKSRSWSDDGYGSSAAADYYNDIQLSSEETDEDIGFRTEKERLLWEAEQRNSSMYGLENQDVIP